MMHQLMSRIIEKGERPTSFEEEWQQRMSVLELIDVAIDMRPAVPYLVSQLHAIVTNQSIIYISIRDKEFSSLNIFPFIAIFMT